MRDAVARFAREARAAVKIKSEHVARVIDVGVARDGRAVHGHGVPRKGLISRSSCSSQGPYPVEEAVDYVFQASEAIAEAHALGIVHRDLKPANLFLIRRADGSSSIKVLDFGISKVMPGKGPSSSDAVLTRTRAVMGSPLYMSPEQMASSRDVDGRTDFWALGAILYELVTGLPPFNAETMPQLCALILNGSAPSLRTVRPQAPLALEAVIQRCLEKDPARRYSNIAEFANALSELAPKRARISIDRISRIIQGVNLSDSSVVRGASSGGLVQTGGSWAETQIGAKTGASRKVLWLVAAGVALLVAGGTFALRDRHTSTGPSADAPTPGQVMPAAPAAAATQVAPSPAPALAKPEPIGTTLPASALSPSASVAATPPGPTHSPPAAPNAPLKGKKPPAAGHSAPTSAVPAPAAPPQPPPASRAPSDLFDDRK